MNREQDGPKDAGCDPPGAVQRNRYFSGKLLTVADYIAKQRYHIERRRLINRAVHGWGVIAGLAVEATAEGALRIDPGLAFDPEGRELVACGEVILERETDLLWLSHGGRPEPASERPDKGEISYWLCAHYAERGIDSVRLDDAFGDSLCEANRICETVIFSLTRRPASADGGEAGAGFDPCRVGKLARIGGVDLDPHAPVPLASVTVGFDAPRAPVFARLDADFQPRRLASAAVAESTEARTGGPLIVRPAKPSHPSTAEGEKR